MIQKHSTSCGECILWEYPDLQRFDQESWYIYIICLIQYGKELGFYIGSGYCGVDGRLQKHLSELNGKHNNKELGSKFHYDYNKPDVQVKIIPLRQYPNTEEGKLDAANGEAKLIKYCDLKGYNIYNITIPITASATLDVIDKIYKKREIDENGCWIFPGCRCDLYAKTDIWGYRDFDYTFDDNGRDHNDWKYKNHRITKPTKIIVY